MQHPDEGTIHAWLDGELPEEQANEIATHAGDCLECSAKIAEARGLIAASTRILTALDDIPAGVIPEEALPPSTPVPGRHRRWYDRTDIRAAAAVLVVAGASYLVVLRSEAPRETSIAADSVQSIPSPSPASTTAEATPVVIPPVAPRVAAQKAVARKAASPEASNEAIPRGALEKPETRAPGIAAGTAARTLRQDAAVATTPVAEPTAALRSSATSAADRVTITTKRGRSVDSVNLSAMGSVAGSARAEAAFGVVEGRVVDKRDDRNLAGAQVYLPGTRLSANTDKDGRFSITNVPAGNHGFIVRRIGYEAQNLVLAVPDDATVTANVALVPATNALSQVVVTGTANVASVPVRKFRVIRVDSTSATRRTVYDVGDDMRVTLSEAPLETGKDEGAVSGIGVRRAAVVPQRTVEAPEKKALDSLATAAPPPTVNTISWTDHGRRYELSGNLPTETLQQLRNQLMQLRK